MKALRQQYQQLSSEYNKNGYYIFVLKEAESSAEDPLAASGDMPRGKQFGCVFMKLALADLRAVLTVFLIFRMNFR